jgi:hypothetical protein
MRSIYAITYHGPVVAVVVGDQAVIAEELTGSARRIIEAKCLYAMQVDAGDLPGPYRDRDAEDYARAAPSIAPPSLRTALVTQRLRRA